MKGGSGCHHTGFLESILIPNRSYEILINKRQRKRHLITIIPLITQVTQLEINTVHLLVPYSHTRASAGEIEIELCLSLE